MISFSQPEIDDSGEEVLQVSLAGELLLDYPLLNKGSAFSEEERRQFGLIGLLPAHVSSMEDQVSRNYENYRRLDSDLGRYMFLTSLQDRNETLFYRLLEEHISEMLPVIYTPVVGAASQTYSHIYRRPRGLYIDFPHKSDMDAMLDHAGRRSVEAIVVTDGERILGLGDLGIGGMGIPVGKLCLYTLCSGIHPATTLPVFLDAGTNNRELLADPLYLGWRHERVTGQEYDDFIDAFVQGVKLRYPAALLQWEDFSRTNARRLLDRYRGEICSFNDDIQGTGAVTLAALLAAVAATGAKLSQQRIVILGAGSAATGVADEIVAAMLDEGFTQEQALRCIWLVDIGGLLHSGRDDLEAFSQKYAQPQSVVTGWKLSNPEKIELIDAVRNVHPTILIGLSGHAGAFDELTVREMAKHVERPIIFPLSNPTDSSEARPGDLIAWTEGRALVATGSPFPEVAFGGRTFHIAQCNNVYIFPGVALGAIASGASGVSDQMFLTAAKTLGALSPALIDPGAALLPPVDAVRDVARRIGLAVALEAQRAGITPKATDEEVSRMVDAKMWRPRYVRYKPCQP
jgi:malate dehydrogenase (oxaloacetate-decarboxylating)